ncbi:MAG: methyl-accepting chemotaxis protein [Terriglobia bacterium]
MERINKWLARLKIAHKLILSSVVFALPIAILLYYVTAQYNRGIRTCEREVAGTALLEVSPRLLRDLREVQSRASLANAGATSSPTGLAQTRKRINDAVAMLQRGEDAGTKDLTDRLSGFWRQLEASGSTMTLAEQAALDHQMVETTTQLVLVILDDSSLILDSELHTYYLMNVTGPLLLQSQAALAEAGSVALKAKAQGRRLDARDLSQIQTQCGALTNTIFPRLRYSLETALREDKRLHGEDSSFQKSVPPLLERYIELATQLSLAAGNSSEPASAALDPDRFVQMASAAEDAGVTLGETSTKELRTLLSKRIDEDRRSRSEALLMSLFCVGLAAGVVVIVTRNITRPLDRVVNLTTDIATGKVKQAFDRLKAGEFREFICAGEGGGHARTRDEICKLIGSVSAMTESLNGLLVKVIQACNQVAGSATQMAAAVREVEASVSEQAASTNQVSATSKEIYATVQDLTRTMGSVTKMVSDAADTASGGVNNLNGIRSAIDGLISSSAEMARTFESINEKTANIDKVITTITKVANRTNLLSLNAAIEAEKAGEKAGGFSVVALEMRRLADQTAVAALDIERQIHEMQQAVREGVSSVDSHAQQTQASSTAVTELSSGLGQVIEGTTKLGPQFEAVNSAMQMQSQGAGQIADAMVNLREAASQTKASLAEFREVAEDLHNAVGELQGEVGRFSTAS